MADRPHHPARFDDPDEKSFLAFLVASQEILDRDPSAELWMDPIPITRQVSPDVAKWARRVNPLLECLDRHYRSAALDELRRCGVDAASPTVVVDRLVENLVRGYRAQMQTSHMRQPAAERASYLERHARLINGVVDLVGGRSINARHEAAAILLNRGIAPKSRKRLDRFHIRRAVQRYQSDLLRHVNRQVLRSSVDLATFLEAEIIGQHLTVAGLCEVYRAARQAKKFPWLAGHDLALALHRNHDLPDLTDRALSVLERRRSAAA